MRPTPFFVAVVLVSSMPFPAAAQSQEAQADEGLEGSATVAPSRGEQGQQVAPEPRRDAANAQHTVERGDTLWDLSQKFLGSPWYWPKVWSYNPEIANPHWIYPGNLVRFFQTGEEVPTQVEVGQPEVEDVDEGAFLGDEEGFSVAGQIGFRSRPSVTISLPGFVTPGEVEGAGRIIGSFAETVLLSYPNSIYVRFTDPRRARVGETYVVFRAGPELEHPSTRESVGFYTQILGEVRITRLEQGGLAVAQIVGQYDEIQRSDLIGPSGESLLRKVAARPADRDVKDATIITGTTSYHSMLGEHATVVVDRGSEHGVKVGNVFHVYRQHDGLPFTTVLDPTAVDEAMPREDVGQCLAVEVKSRATVCLVSRSLRELVRGDKAEIRAGGVGSPRASR